MWPAEMAAATLAMACRLDEHWLRHTQTQRKHNGPIQQTSTHTSDTTHAPIDRVDAGGIGEAGEVGRHATFVGTHRAEGQHSADHDVYGEGKKGNSLSEAQGDIMGVEQQSISSSKAHR